MSYADLSLVFRIALSLSHVSKQIQRLAESALSVD